MKKTSARPGMPAANRTLILNHFQEQEQEQAQAQNQAQAPNQEQAHDQEQEENQGQTQDQDRALFSDRKDYCIADIWGDTPILTNVTGKENATTPPETEVVSEPKRSWFARLIRRFGGSGHRSLRIAQ